ncbi:MAG: amidase, partial [Novosphingobium sp.]|nr:amidase [Novosphingobium sp.]
MRNSALALAVAAGLVALPAQGQSVADYLARIAAVDDSGPMLNAVLAINPDAASQAAAAQKIAGPLAGKALLIKDNIEMAGPLPTTAGSLALKDSVTGRDAPLVARLRRAGAVFLGKTNLSEWAN